MANRAVGAGEAAIGRRGQTQVLRWLEQFENLAIDTVYTSPQPQSAEAARALATHKQVEVETDPRLTDQDMGSWQGRVWDEIVQEEGAAVQEFFSNFGDAAAPEGESLGVALERMLEWWQEVAPGSLKKTVAVVTSGSMLSAFATAMLGMRLSRSVSLSLPHGGVGVLDCFQNGVRITSWNPDALAGL